MKLTKFKDISLTNNRAIVIEDLPEIGAETLRKELKDKATMYGIFALPMLMIAIVIAATLPPSENLMPLSVFKYAQIALYLISMGIFFFCIYKVYNIRKLIKILGI